MMLLSKWKYPENVEDIDLDSTLSETELVSTADNSEIQIETQLNDNNLAEKNCIKE